MNHPGVLQLLTAPSYSVFERAGATIARQSGAIEFPASPSSLNLSCLCNITSRKAVEMLRPGAQSRGVDRADLWTHLFKGRMPEFTWEGESDGDKTVRVEMVSVW